MYTLTPTPIVASVMRSYVGWGKAVVKFGLKGDDKAYTAPITQLGQLAAVAVTLGFNLVVIAAHLRANAP